MDSQKKEKKNREHYKESMEVHTTDIKIGTLR